MITNNVAENISNVEHGSELFGQSNSIIDRDDLILVTGANGFIGARVIRALLERGYTRVRCFVRSLSNATALTSLAAEFPGVELFPGNLLSKDNCSAAIKDVKVVLHLAAGRAEKSFPEAFLNSVVTTRNLLDACVLNGGVKRFVNVSSFVVYTNAGGGVRRLLDESCPIETRPELRNDPYCFAKVKQDEIVTGYGEKFGLQYVIVRPGYVYGPGKQAITGRVGIDTFGFFCHLGGSNTIPFTYVDNCAEAIVLAGTMPGVDREVFNVVDDNLPSSRQFLRMYKRQVKRFSSIYLPHAVSYLFCWAWEKYSKWSEEQLPPAFNRKKWQSFWKRTKYSNNRLKARLGWSPKVDTNEGLRRYFEACRKGGHHA